MANGSWLIQWSTFGLLAISLGQLPVVANNARSVRREVAQATPLVVNRPVLKTGSQGADVSELQAALKLLGYFTGTVDGFYGESTAIAVSRFQQASGINPDGIAGSATWNRLFPSVPVVQTPPSSVSNTPPTSSSKPALRAPVPSSVQTTTNNSNRNRSVTTTPNVPTTVNPQPIAVTLPILKQGMRGSAIAHLQERLRTLGFFSGTVDGVFGEATQAAVKSAQRNFNLEPDGIVGSATWSALLR